MKRILLSGWILFALSLIAQAKVDLPSLFSDNMVLQQNSSAAVWGMADPKAKIVITTTWSKAKTTVIADDNGKWMARIDTPTAGGPYEITFNDGDKVTIKNVLIGEVWICSGQSNMAQPMKGYMGQPTAEAVDYITEATPDVPIRSCNLKRQVS